VSDVCQIGFEGKWEVVMDNVLKANFICMTFSFY
jgi:hypothetical protein